MHSVSLESDYLDERRAHAVERSVAAEGGEIDDTRSGAHVAREGWAAVVAVEASDLVALRMGVNSWICLVETVKRATPTGSTPSESV